MIHFVCLKILRTSKNVFFYNICFIVLFFPFQDYKVHRDEIHSKLVQIMRERLLVHLRGLPQIVESCNALQQLQQNNVNRIQSCEHKEIDL